MLEIICESMVDVTSSNVVRIGHKNADLFVEYNGGGIYKYTGVPKELYEELLKSESKGKYLNEHIKAKFKFEKLM